MTMSIIKIGGRICLVCSTSFCDWSKKLAQLFQSIRSKNNTFSHDQSDYFEGGLEVTIINVCNILLRLQNVFDYQR